MEDIDDLFLHKEVTKLIQYPKEIMYSPKIMVVLFSKLVRKKKIL
jgi:hypothetical protein